jgi:hypothetical protein
LLAPHHPQTKKQEAGTGGRKAAKKRNALDVTGLTTIGGNSALALAVRHGHASVVEYLLSQQAAFDLKNPADSSAFHAALDRGAASVASKLLQHLNKPSKAAGGGGGGGGKAAAAGGAGEGVTKTGTKVRSRSNVPGLEALAPTLSCRESFLKSDHGLDFPKHCCFCRSHILPSHHSMHLLSTPTGLTCFAPWSFAIPAYVHLNFKVAVQGLGSCCCL